MEHPHICGVCKGKCCRSMGCHFSPEDFEEITFEKLKSEIDKGYLSIDWWEGAVKEFYLRVRHINSPIVDPSYGGICVLWDKVTGCPLPYEKRPKGARLLHPKGTFSDEECVGEYTKQDSKNDWAEYRNILMQLYLYYNIGGKVMTYCEVIKSDCADRLAQNCCYCFENTDGHLMCRLNEDQEKRCVVIQPEDCPSWECENAERCDRAFRRGQNLCFEIVKDAASRIAGNLSKT